MVLEVIDALEQGGARSRMMGVGIQTLRPDRSGFDLDHQCASEGCRCMRNVRSAHESSSLRHQGKTGTWCLVILEVPSPYSRKPPPHIERLELLSTIAPGRSVVSTIKRVISAC